MRAEREREAADEIARGGEAAQRVRATADRTVVELTSDARRKAEIVRALRRITPGEGVRNEWLEPVTDEEYDALPVD